MIKINASPVSSSIPFDNSTNGFTATDVQTAIEEALNEIPNQQVSATADTTTTSGTDVLLNSMTLTPVAGTYLALFNSSIISNSAGAVISASFYLDAAQQASSLRKIAPFDGGTLSALNARGIMSSMAIITVSGAQAINVRWSTSGGTATCGPRSLFLIRVG